MNLHEILVPTPPKPLVKDAKDFGAKVSVQANVDILSMILYDEST